MHELPNTEAITNILEDRSHVDKIGELEDEVAHLKEKLQEMSKIMSHYSQHFDDYEPAICEACGCTLLWKNGRITRKESGQSVQRFTCSNCKANIYIVKKNFR